VASHGRQINGRGEAIIPEYSDVSISDWEVIADPHPFLHHVRASDPVHWDPKWHGWLVTRRDDLIKVMEDPQTYSSAFDLRSARGDSSASEDDLAAVSKVLSKWTVWVDPPAHTRVRKVMASRFKPGMISKTFADVGGVQAYSKAMSEALIDDALRDDTIEIVAAVASPLPMLVAGKLLGIPPADGGKLKAWSDAMLDVVFGDAPDRFARARPAVDEMAAYFRHLCAARRRQPREDVTSYLVARTSQDEGLVLTDDELVGVLTHLLFAGHTTTSDLIGGMMVAFHDHPDQQAVIRARPELAQSAAVEAMRFVTPVKAQPRTATCDTELRGRSIKHGDPVLPLMIAANRDPATYSDPDNFDIARTPNPQLGFGRGIHFCVGSGIALAEAAGFLEAFFGRFNKMEIAVPYSRPTDLSWHRLMLQRGLQRLPLRTFVT